MFAFEKETEVKDWMRRNYLTIQHTSIVRDAIHLVMQVELNELPVIQEDKIIGVFNLKTYVQALQSAEQIDQTDSVTKWMSKTFAYVMENEKMMHIETVPSYVVDTDYTLIGVVDQAVRHDYHKAAVQEIKRLQELDHWYSLTFDLAYEGLVIVDNDGIIRVMNDAYCRYVGLNKEQAVGKRAADVIENTRLPVVLKTGVPERSQAHVLGGHNLVVHRLPIWRDKKVVGAVGMLLYEGVAEIYQAVQRMQKLEVTDKEGLHIHWESEEERNAVVRFDDILGDSLIITRTKNIAIRASDTKATVLITGESGVGKEQFAKAIHDMGVMKAGNFVSINCAAIPDNLIESELFGYEEGAFTGAKRGGHKGKFEMAHNGTLFLDEIGEMSLNIQAKILRVLQEREVERIGGTEAIPIDTRIIAATNRNLKEMVQAGEFREDLYYRLNVIPIEIPPLRERLTDIPLIVSHKLRELAKKYGKEKTIEEQIIRKFYNHSWPGNVRELINMLERLYVLTDEDHIRINDLTIHLFQEHEQTIESPVHTQPVENLEELLEMEDKRSIIRALQETGGNKTRAAQLLNISRATLYNKLNRYKMS